MTTQVEREKETVQEETVSSVRALVLRALADCARKRGAGDAHVLELLRQGDGEALGYFRYAVAREAGAFAAQQDPTIQDVYVVEAGSDPDEQPRPTSFLTVIVVVREVTAATRSLWTWISDRVTAEYKALLDAPQVAQMGSLLDVHLVTETEVQQRSGMAVLVSSLYTPALPVWQRGG